MELQWGHRLSAMESSVSPEVPMDSGPGFNGATAFRRWKVRYPRRYQWTAAQASMGPPPFGDGKFGIPGGTNGQRPRLQWGHRLSAMERGSTLAGWHRLFLASMGPPPFGDGKLEGHAVHQVHQLGFNGATAFRRWKVPDVFVRSHHQSPLQWGHRLSAMERGSARTASA